MEYIDEIIAEIEHKISYEKTGSLTSEQEYYVAGLADALQIIKEIVGKFAVGRKYFVIVNHKGDLDIEEMTLYRINKKTKFAYCFTRDASKPQPDLVLYSKQGMEHRVFSTYEEAKNGLPLYRMSLLTRR